MAGEQNISYVPTQCDGAAAVPGLPAPLGRSVHITAKYDFSGNPIGADGFTYLDQENGTCLASGAVEAPNCLYAPRTREAAISKQPAAIVAEPSIPPFQSLTPKLTNGELATNSDVIPSITDISQFDPTYADYLILQPDGHELQLNFQDLSREISNRENLREALSMLTRSYQEALIMSGTLPTWKERTGRIYRQSDAMFPIGAAIRAVGDKGGDTTTKINKRLPNGLSEPFDFTYHYEGDGKVRKITVKFPAAEMKIQVENDQISDITLELGNERRTDENAMQLLKAHGKQNSALDRIVRSTPAEPFPEGRSLTGVTNITLSLKELTVGVKNFFREEGKSGTGYYSQDLSYSAQYNKFITKNDLEGEHGISVVDYLKLTLDVLQLLPFARIAPNS